MSSNIREKIKRKLSMHDKSSMPASSYTAHELCRP